MAYLEEGIKLFNKGHYFKAHEELEKVWLKLEESPEKRFYSERESNLKRGLIFNTLRGD